jgi:hypothetical protein
MVQAVGLFTGPDLDRVTVARLRMLLDELVAAGVGLGVGGCPG